MASSNCFIVFLFILILAHYSKIRISFLVCAWMFNFLAYDVWGG